MELGIALACLSNKVITCSEIKSLISVYLKSEFTYCLILVKTVENLISIGRVFIPLTIFT